jgi:tryptophan-rich sensory protein
MSEPPRTESPAALPADTPAPAAADRARSLLTLAIALGLPLAVGAAGGAITAGSVRTWYPTLRKPPFNPPSWVFAPVWTGLYLLMGVALHLVIRGAEAGPGRRRAVGWWAAQLVLNFLWSFIFFGRRAIGPAFGEILVLWLSIAATIRAFAGQQPAAAALLVPYLGWTSFATLLNGSLWALNRER